ncbi:MAG: MFS transporter [Chloroflexi bacterium]|nr:MFS transporter [Chloroflexota bacterium]
MARVLSANYHSLTRAFAFPHGWKFTLSVIFFAQVLSAVGYSMMFPFLPLHIDTLGTSTGLSTELAAGLVISVQGLTMMVTAPFWGVAADRFGRKKMIMRAMFGGAITMAMMAFAQTAEQLIVIRAMQGLVTGTVSANNALVAAATPRHRVGFAMGALQLGLWAGVAIGPLMGGIIADHFGYNIPYLLTGVLLAAGGLVVLFGVSENFSDSKESVKFDAMSLARGWKDILGTSGVGLALIIRFLSGLARTIIVPIAPLFVVSLIARESATSNTYAGLFMAVSAAASTIGAVYLGNLGDRISHRKVLFYCSTAAAIFYVPQALVADVWQLLILQALAGFAAGGLVAAPSALLSRYAGTERAGAIYGLENSVMSGSRAAAPLFGATVALMLGMRGTFLASAVVFALIALIVWRLLPQDKIEPARKGVPRAKAA